MKLRYIGYDRLYGLTTGKVYNVEILSKDSYIWVKADGIKITIPYDGPLAVANNWEKA